MPEINHFKFAALCSGDVVMIGQIRWITRMLRELVDADLFI
jgi:hypothetical protein